MRKNQYVKRSWSYRFFKKTQTQYERRLEDEKGNALWRNINGVRRRLVGSRQSGWRGPGDSKKGNIETVANLAGKMGEDLRALVNKYTGIDTHDLY